MSGRAEARSSGSRVGLPCFRARAKLPAGEAPSAMNITLSVNGRFHAFDVAHELHRRGLLHTLITSYPKRHTRRWSIPDDRTVALPLIEVAKRVIERAFGGPAELLAAPFDALASRLIPRDSHVVETWSGSSLWTIERARSLGIPSVLKRSSAHITVQSELLVEEYARWGASGTPVPSFIIERELAEYESADYILASSSYIARTLLERGVPRAKVLTIPLAVDTRQFAPAPMSHEGFRVVFCGSATLQKGIPYLLQAMKRLAGRGVELWFVGSVSPEVRGLFDQFGGPWIRELGRVAHHELPSLYGQCDVLCLPSIQEGFGTVVAQAMACGLPVIVSENVGAADLVDAEVGTIVPIRDVDALERSIQRLLEDRETCRAMGRAAERRVRRGSSWSDYVDRLVEVYATRVLGRADETPAELPVHDRAAGGE